MISVLTTAETVVMIFIDLKAGVPFIVEWAAGEAASIHLQTLKANEVFKVDPIFNVLKDVACHISSLYLDLIESIYFIRRTKKKIG